MTVKKKTALITDLDNTLFDWVDVWLKSFRAMLNEIIRISDVSEKKLIPEIQAIHQKYGTSEYSFLIEEIPSLQPILKGRKAADVFKTAIEAYRTQRLDKLREHLKV
jgi:FMN phosphatase YigB (HAD superfamily)